MSERKMTNNEARAWLKAQCVAAGEGGFFSSSNKICATLGWSKSVAHAWLTGLVTEGVLDAKSYGRNGTRYLWNERPARKEATSKRPGRKIIRPEIVQDVSGRMPENARDEAAFFVRESSGKTAGRNVIPFPAAAPVVSWQAPFSGYGGAVAATIQDERESFRTKIQDENLHPEIEQVKYESEDEGKFQAHLKLKSVVLTICLISLGIFFGWQGWCGLGVTLEINRQFIASLGASSNAIPLLREAVGVIGNIAAFGPGAIHILLCAGARRLAFSLVPFVTAFILFGIAAASGFISQNTAATASDRAALASRVKGAEDRMDRAQAAIEASGSLPAMETLQASLIAARKALGGTEKPCQAARQPPQVEATCRQLADIRSDILSAGKRDVAENELAAAIQARDIAKSEAAKSGIEIGSEANPQAVRVAEMFATGTFGLIPLSPLGVEVIHFFLEILCPEMAVFICFWASGALFVYAGATLVQFKRKRI